VHRHPDHHFHSLLAQFGLTPKSRRGLGAGEVVDQPTALHSSISARPSLRAFVSDFAPLDCAASGDFT